MNNTVSIPRPHDQVMVNSFVRSVYNWMAFGLALTGIVAWFTASSEAMIKLIFTNQLVFFGLIIAELVMVFSLAARVHKMQASTATALYVIYAAINGLTLSFIFIMYTRASIANTFFVCAATFGAVSIYGYTTKRDLTSMGSFLFMGLVGIIIASVVNFFLKSPMMYWIITYAGVGIFIGLTAYDTQKIKNMALTMPADIDGGAVRKGAIMGALALYLDFINLFLLLLRIMGNARD